MNWTEQIESMMKVWTGAQKQFAETQGQLLGGWQSLANGMPGMSGVPGMSAMPNLSNPMSWFMSGLPAWAKNSTTGQSTAGNLFSSQAMMMQSLGMLAQAWQAIAPSLAAGKPWQSDFDTFLKQWSKEVLGAPQRFSAAGMDMNELMKSFLGEWGPLLKPWLASIQGMGLGGPLGDILGGEGFPFGKLFGAGTEPAFRDLAQIPMIGVGREQIAKITRAFDAHVDMRKAAQKYQAAIAKTIGEAMKETMEQLVELSKKGEQIGSVRELIRIWVKIADRQFTRMYVSDEFIGIQGEVSRASLQNKLAQRAVLEVVLKQFDIPTRTELDDAYKTLHNLKNEVRELRNARKQSESDAMALRDAHKRATSEITKLRSTSRKVETEIALLHDALENMEARLLANESEASESEEASKPAPVPSEPALSEKGKADMPKVAVSPAGVREPVKVTKKKVPPQKATT
uniref:Poly(3-hydroxyalkanoate) polymerase subunit PhaE n=1 Tax=Candidatus Kentrum eta TaxID=2126337 RepID=A0A450VI85_9GAMM|nr:MAG: poly(R)-hydroxyalkanoic acid synthase, class III, PhaE subunit [Candidatus Kentron sp. H]VFK00310.1 MAG: poly(R)-hydroxyalkanoic acid synthase, class III, PhaE subunit [Candidatus Kentron sp. H]VFK04431.1 MAG: poly(R)-hydroxyalkanoic acid synthase, class III, PhaE subunit [Candidatus Kentron sp. H]